MAFLSNQEKRRIAEAVRFAERSTRGELVAVIARTSDDYAHVPWLWGSLTALAVPGFFELFDLETPLLSAHITQVVVFALVVLLLSWQPLKIRLVPRALKDARASRLAREQFLLQRLHATRERTGVLIFVSVAERYVEIIADEGINNVVPPGTWDGIVERFVAKVKASQTAEGFLTAVEECGRWLADNFPPRPDDINELPNALVEI
jgi:putative membrane protein